MIWPDLTDTVITPMRALKLLATMHQISISKTMAPFISHHIAVYAWSQDENINLLSLGGNLRYGVIKWIIDLLDSPTKETHYWLRSSHNVRDNYSDVIMSAIASHITGASIVSIVCSSKENTKAPRYGPLWGEFTGDWWIPRAKASNAENVFIFYCTIAIIHESPNSRKVSELMSFIFIWYL